MASDVLADPQGPGAMAATRRGLLLILKTRIVRQNLNDLSTVAKLLYEDGNPSTGKKQSTTVFMLDWQCVCVCVFLKKKRCMCYFVFSNKHI